MKDAMAPCEHTTGDIIYKEVVVVGNGPSGMVTSFMLAGHVPRLKEVPTHLAIDEMLKARLSNLKPGTSLYEADLVQLAEGLEGRSQNPVPLLMDNLLRPGADADIQADTLIKWEFHKDKQIDHIVLGRGPPGGSWQTFPAAVQTLSPASWLTLPPILKPEILRQDSTKRLSAKQVAEYFEMYVNDTKLEHYFNDVDVESVTLHTAEGPPCGLNCPRNARYCVTGTVLSKTVGGPRTRKPTKCRYTCNRVVIACGANDIPNTLHLPQLDELAVYSLADVARQIDMLEKQDVKRPTVLVVGSGMSAADAVQMALKANFNVAHVHKSPADTLAKLSPITYPEYAKICKMMTNGLSTPNYTPYSEYEIIDVTIPNSHNLPKEHMPIGPTVIKKIKLRNTQNEVTEIPVNVIAVFIGSRPNLSFLQINYDLNCTPDLEPCKKCNEIQNGKLKMQSIKSPWQSVKDLLRKIGCNRMFIPEINGNELTEKDWRYNFIESEIEGKRDKNVCTCYMYKNACNTDPYGGPRYGKVPKNPVDGRENPIAIDKSSHQLFYAPKGVYALGPLTGDNVIRFIPGGALAIVASIHKDKKAA